MPPRSPEVSPPTSSESERKTPRQKATESWNKLSEGLEKKTITAGGFLDESRVVLDHMHTLPKDKQKVIKKAFKELRKDGKETILNQLKPALIEQINSHQGKALRDQDIKVAELLGLMGNKLGLGNVDKDISQALGADSPIKRRRIKTATAAAIIGAAGGYWGPEAVQKARTWGPDALKLMGMIAKVGSYKAEAAMSDGSELTAPQPKPKTRIASPSPAAPPPASPSPAPSSPSPEPATATPTKEATATSTSTPKPTETPSPTATTEPTPEPIPEPEETPEPESEEPSKEDMVEIGDKNLAEFFLGNWLLELKGKGSTLWNEDASYRERVTKQNAESDNITMVYLGTDNERDRDRRASNVARSDVIMIEVFNPHTFQTTSISLNRDLFAPEVTAEYSGFDRINAVTMLPAVKKDINPYPLVQRMIESATGLRVDGIVQTNIDFVNGYDAYHDTEHGYQEGKNSIIDRFTPEGLEVNPPNAITDSQYPKGYGVQRVHFDKGPQVLHGQDLVRYARARKGENNDDYRRSERQREVAFKLFTNLAGKLLNDLDQGKTDTLDLTLEVLNEQQEVGNFFQYDIDLLDMIGGINESIKQILEQPNGQKVIRRLVANSTDNVTRMLEAEVKKRSGLPLGDPERGFVSFGLSSSDGSLEGHQGSVTRIRGSGPHVNRRTANGNFIDYWQPLRDKVVELIG